MHNSDFLLVLYNSVFIALDQKHKKNDYYAVIAIL